MNESVIDAIRKILAMAEHGEITGVAIATIAPDLSTGNAYMLGDGTLSELLGSVELLKYRMLQNSDHEVD